MSSKSPATPMTNCFQTAVWDGRLPKTYFLSMCLNGLQSCRLSNFFHFSKFVLFFLCIIFSYENSTTYEHFWFFEVQLKLWQGVIHKPCGQDFDHFWPPTHLRWTSVDISMTTHLCPCGHSCTHLQKSIYTLRCRLLMKVAIVNLVFKNVHFGIYN